MIPRNRREIRTDILQENMRKIRAGVPVGVKVLAVVKADGYGHGAAETSRAALAGGADMLAVASVGEGVSLRQAGIEAPVLVLGAVLDIDAYEGIQYGLTQTVCTPEMVRICETAAAAQGKTADVHLKIDTGMGRIGVRSAEERDAVLNEIAESRHVRLTGVFTHLSDADGDEDGMAYTEEQFLKFRQMTDGLPEDVIRHCANSATIHRRPDMAMNMVRAGISLYGYPPVEDNIGVKPAMRWTAKISYIKELPAGEYISYGRTYRTDRPTRVATVTCGYADGYHRAASGKAEVLICGRRAPILGRICMDQMMADITGIDGVQVDDEAVLMGTDGDECISAEDLAKWSGTISYEILVDAANRVERVFCGCKEEGKD